MSETKNLKLFKNDDPENNTEKFNATKSLNENWDKLDTGYEQLKNENEDLKTKNKLIEKLLPKVQGTSNIVSLNNTAAAPLYDFQLLGDTVQDGTPNMDTPVFINSVGSNVNYFDVDKMVYPASTNLQKQGDKYVGTSVKNILLGTSSNSVPQIEQELEAGEYTFSCNLKPSKQVIIPKVYLCVVYNDNTAENIANSTVFVLSSYSTMKIFWTIQVPKKVKKIGIVCYLSDTVNINVSEIKLELGKKVTTYSNYEKDRENVKVTSKNVLGNYTVGSSVKAYATSLSALKGSLLPNTTYTISFNSNEAGNQYYPNEQIFTTQQRFITSKGKNSVTVTTKAYIKTYPFSTDLLKNGKDEPNPISIINPQVEVGSEATNYVSHIENNFDFDFSNLELSKIGDYQDRLYKENGKWYKEEKIGSYKFTGNESFYTMRVQMGFNIFTIYHFLPEKIYIDNSQIIGVCNRFKATAWDNRYREKDMYFLDDNNNNVARFVTNKFTSNEEFAQYLKDNETIIKYIKLEPTIEKISDTNLINQLNAISNSSSFENNTVATLYNDVGQIKITAYKNGLN